MTVNYQELSTGETFRDAFRKYHEVQSGVSQSGRVLNHPTYGDQARIEYERLRGELEDIKAQYTTEEARLLMDTSFQVMGLDRLIQEGGQDSFGQVTGSQILLPQVEQGLRRSQLTHQSDIESDQELRRLTLEAGRVLISVPDLDSVYAILGEQLPEPDF